MINIPTELLRTLVAVVELRSFTRAAQVLGVTQPAVSAQIKRLQSLLGGELLDKSAPGVSLTPRGERVVDHARRLLAINDQILDATAGGDRLRVGITADYLDGPAVKALAQFRAARPQFRFQITTDTSDALLRKLGRGECDLVVTASDGAQPAGARHCWRESASWAAATPSAFGRNGPVPLVTLGENCLLHHLAIASLQQAGFAFELIYAGRSLQGVVTAVASGLGVTCLPRRFLLTTGLSLLDSDAGYPKVPDFYGAILLRDGLVRSDADELSALLAKAMGSGDAAEL